MTPKVTVLIPNYNGARFLDHCFEGLLCQTNQDFECVFLDDGSTDDSVAIAKSYITKLPQLKIEIFENGGIAINWNRGVDFAKTDFFTLLHCDDSYEPRYLEEMLGLMAGFPDAAIGHCASQAIAEDSRPIFSVTEFYKHALFLPSPAFQREIKDEYASLLQSDFINCPSVIYKTDAVRSIGHFDTKLEQTLDWDYWFRVLKAGFPICGTDKKLYQYRRHSSNHTVINSKSLARYSEELICLKNAFEEGKSLGYSQGQVDLEGLRNIVMVDIANALWAGHPGRAQSLIEFLDQMLGVNRAPLYLLKSMVVGRRLGGFALLSASRVIIGLMALRIKMLQWI